MMVKRISAPGKPIILVDLGPGMGLRHSYDAMRRTIDAAPVAGPPPRPRHPVDEIVVAWR